MFILREKVSMFEIMKGLVVCLFAALLAAAAVSADAASLTDTIRVSVSVKQDCNFNDKDVKFDSYAVVNDGRSTLDGDLSMGCATNSSLKIDVSADGKVIYSQTLLDEGFSNQIHIEKDDDGSVRVWQCDSLDDVPPVDRGNMKGGPGPAFSDQSGSKPVDTIVHVAM